MDLTIPKRDLLRLLSQVSRVSERKSTMPVLSNVLFQAEGTKLRLSATDLYLGVSGTVPAEIAKTESMAIPAKELLDRLKMMPDGPISLSQTDKHQIILKAGGSARRYTLRGLPGTDFPPLPRPAEGAPTLSLDAKVLGDLIAKTAFSVSTDETRAHLNSALFEWEGETVRMVTTDGHRLSKAEAKVSGAASSQMLIPLKAIQELRRMCEETSPEEAGKGRPITITRSESVAFFEAGGMTFSTKLTDAQFPPYAQVIPKTSTKTVKAPRAALADAIRAVMVAANSATLGVKLAIAKGVIVITSESPESGDASDEVAVEYTGSPVTIGFNAKYVLDALGALGTDDVTLGLTGDLDPMVVRPGGEQDGAEFLGVVMPCRI